MSIGPRKLHGKEMKCMGTPHCGDCNERQRLYGPGLNKVLGHLTELEEKINTMTDEDFKELFKGIVAKDYPEFAQVERMILETKEDE